MSVGGELTNQYQNNAFEQEVISATFRRVAIVPRIIDSPRKGFLKYLLLISLSPFPIDCAL
jgi:hypothetical protein